MLLRDLTKVYISEYEEIKEHGEPTKKWKYKGKALSTQEISDMSVNEVNSLEVRMLSIENNRGIAYLNMQQDVNELDRNSAGEVDYSVVNARTEREYDIKKGDGISLKDISNTNSFVPDYTVSDCPKIGKTVCYKLKKYNGEIEEDEY